MSKRAKKDRPLVFTWLATGGGCCVFAREIREVGQQAGYTYFLNSSGKCFVRETVDDVRAAIAKAEGRR